MIAGMRQRNRVLGEVRALLCREASQLAYKRNQLQKRKAGQSPAGLTKSGPGSGAGAPKVTCASLQ